MCGKHRYGVPVMATVGDENDPMIGDRDMSVPAVVARPDPELDGAVLLPMPPQDGFTAEDLDRIPDLPPHTELIDGNLVLVSPQKSFHTFMLDLLVMEMRSRTPETLLACREMTVTLGERQRPEPDLVIIDVEAYEGPNGTSVTAESVRLAVEVLSPESEVRDRGRKPRLYAQAGIPHFWLVEQEGDYGSVVYVYELDPVNEKYTNVSVQRSRLKVDVPCRLDIDLTRLPRPPRAKN